MTTTTQENDPAKREPRLAALKAYDVLDTPAEQGFDDIVLLATQLCDAPVALVSLVDRDRQWFKARVGFEPCETDLERSVCRHALGRTDILEIADLTADPRTKDNPLVTSAPHLRFYAGAPLTAPDGETLGTLCVIDHRPRPAGLGEARRIGLKALANQVMAQLDLRRAAADRAAGEKAALAEAQRLEALIATQQAVAAATADLGSAFQALVDGALGVIGHADGAVVELREGDEFLYASVSGALAAHKGIRLPMGRTLSGRAVREERPLLCSDTHADPLVDRALCDRLGIRSMVAVPVARRGETVGALKLQSGRPDAFGPRDVAMAQMLAGLVASAFGDVAEMRSSRALREAENRYRRTFESVTEFGVVVTDLDCVVTEWNTGAERIFGWSASEVVGRSAAVIFTPEDRQAGQMQLEMRQALGDGQAVDERWHLRKDGSRLYASGNMMPLRDDDGRHIGFIKIVRDRTEQHLAGQRLEESERRLRQAQEAGGVGLFTIDIASDAIVATPEFARLYGLDPLASRSAGDFERLVLSDDRDFVSNRATRRAGLSPTDVEYRIRRADTGETRWIARKGEFVFDAEGRPASLVGVARDITDRKTAEQALAASESKWRGLFENLQEGFILGQVIRDADGRIVDWRYEEVNRAWGEFVGIPSERAAGRTIRELFPGIEDAWVEEFADVVETGRPVHFTRQVGTLDRWYDGVAQPAGADRFTVIFLETTPRVLAERRREALRELGDVLLTADEPDTMSNAAAAVIGRALGVGRVGYGAVAGDGETFTVPEDWTKEGFASLKGVYRMSQYGTYAGDLREGRTVVIPDIRLDPRTAGDTGPLEGLAVRTLVNHPIVENGRTVAILYVNDDRPRNWTAEEIAFLADAADRTRAAIERRTAEANLGKAREKLHLAIDAAAIGIFDYDLAAADLQWDERCRALFGLPPGAPVTYDTFLAGLHPDDREWVDAAVARSLDPAGEGGYDVEYRTVGVADGVERWVAARGQTFFENGRAVRFIGTVRDVTAAKCAEAELRESQRQLLFERGLLQAVFQQAPLGISIAYADGRGEVNARLEQMLGHDARGEGDERYAGFGAVHADGRPYAVEDYPTIRALRSGETLIDEPMAYRNGRTGEVRRWEVSTKPVLDGEGNTLAAVSVIVDAEDRLRAEEHRTVLNRELSHRLKNTLAVVQSIATQTLRAAADIPTARKTLTERIGALSRAHDILLTGQRDAAPIAEIVRAATSLHAEGDRVQATGPDIRLGPKASLTLSLILHELSTNAGKYGALSVDGGIVDVEWTVESDPATGRPDLSFAWREIGGPPVTPPARKSFGTRLIEMGLSSAGGSAATVDYAPGGVVCRLAAPLEELQSPDDA